MWIVRHGESAGNVAAAAAHLAGLHTIDIDLRDQDVPLSELGRQQSRAVGRWFGALPEPERPTVVVCSPYVRAMQTAELLVDAAGLSLAGPVMDERLREKELGSLDRFTKAGIVQRFPHEAELRARVGKFYYRPPGGESWCDVVLRLRSFVDSVQLQFRHERVLVVAHQVIVLCFRYVLERMTEAQILAIDREKDVANCSVTAYVLDADEAGRPALALTAYNFVAPLEEAHTPVTARPDVPPQPK
ncbi:MAG: histidine phosphatase family protein [Myxococcota bacterium]|nr:histidine phosphatase family protein [Deltaproteobacteria bacterium]MDQ3340549.1 histidine phosphatase family protein [Myxococcota bacterium]